MVGVLMDYMEASRLLKKYGIKSVESTYVSNADEAIKFAGEDRIVLKVLSQKALHKSRNGLVELDLKGSDSIENAFNRLIKKAQQFEPYKVLAQKMVNKGVEVIVGGKIDPQFGKLVLIGLGGIYVETFKDFALRVCPIKSIDAESMLEQLKSEKIIAPDDKTRKMLVNLLVNASRMFYENEISELDLNPVIVYSGSYEAVDLRILK
jgi:succinyl-CoA synthetase beta subunit